MCPAAMLARATGRHRDIRLAGLGRGECREEPELIAVGEAAPLDDDARENTEAGVDDGACGAVEVRLLGLERGVLESGERGAELFVGAAVHTAADRAQKRMKREGDRTVGRGAGLLVPAPQLDVDVLVEGAGETIAGVREDAPSAARRRQIRNRRVIRGITEPEHRQGFERPVERDRPRSRSASRGENHVPERWTTAARGARRGRDF